ncbi:MAG: Phosphatidate cytidylyltransferase [Deltaproteobacteria bacterium ADurb.BinA179]|jgi:phosphatidate cytidylyltransferase|nr:phosphatidate cytidylyltransferase [Deltaproteobacteria bacterium]MDI9542853.1 phosphatidate cytidylyltransferase [Pseudomonadota bacterium]NLW68383.1 phosphatidate cytidylyltransferase [Bacteriovoracaceae bacterium]OPZ25806.1 MAG: Phosphatidate cytidylyltransferase [Deltaproteobacteria bacterium ADurb.BinA179]HRR22215.1 phosphatidate cytidylyltransferase [Desulfomonilia bacterium]
MIRIFGALILLVIFAVPAVLGPAWAFFIVVLAVIPVCLYEFYRVGLEKDARPLGALGLVGSFLYLYTIYMCSPAESLLTLCGIGAVILIAGLYLFEKGRATARQVSFALSGLIYPLGLLSFWILVRNGIDGRFWMIFGLLATFLADVGAYYVGKNLGRHPLAPRLSPKKTVEGLFGGVAASILGASLFFFLYPRFLPLEASYPLWVIPVLAGAISILDLAGDLSASMYKRDFHVKDMGSLIPGHGGMLDRMDGVVPVGVFLYFVIRVLQ